MVYEGISTASFLRLKVSHIILLSSFSHTLRYASLCGAKAAPSITVS